MKFVIIENCFGRKNVLVCVFFDEVRGELVDHDAEALARLHCFDHGGADVFEPLLPRNLANLHSNCQPVKFYEFGLVFEEGHDFIYFYENEGIEAHVFSYLDGYVEMFYVVEDAAVHLPLPRAIHTFFLIV